jgi:palmitoyltransferase ZDHHC13/17
MSRNHTPDTATPSGQVLNGHVELQDISNKSKLSVEDDLMALARLGEIKAIQDLFASKKYTATYRDEQGITPLHVSLSNSHQLSF